MNENLNPISEAIKSAAAAAIATHVNPDGDAIGSALGLGLALARMGKKIAVIIPEDIPDIYHFLPGHELVIKNPRSLSDPKVDVLICVDSADRDRVDEKIRKTLEFKRLINIDHHASNPGFGDLNWVDPGAASTADMILTALETMGVEITPPVAACLYTAHITDTGCFRFGNTDARAMDTAAKLLRAGAVAYEIVHEIYHNKPLSMLKLMGLSLGEMGHDPEMGFTWSWVTMDMYRRADAREFDTEGIVDALQTVKGTRVALFMREVDGGKNVKISLRSQGCMDVGKIAAMFDGGGHPEAAGATVPGPVSNALNLVREKIAGSMARK